MFTYWFYFRAEINWVLWYLDDICMKRSSWWNEERQGNPKYSEEANPSATLFKTKSTGTDVRLKAAEPSPSWDVPMWTNRGTAEFYLQIQLQGNNSKVTWQCDTRGSEASERWDLYARTDFPSEQRFHYNSIYTVLVSQNHRVYQ
jgi:hypothetical protein